MRLFTAIELTDEARDAIRTEQALVAETLGRDGNSSPRFVRPEHMHLTLSFMGAVADHAAPAIVSAISQNLPVAQFQVAFGGIGVFPPRGAPRVLWLGVSAGRQAIVDLQKLVVMRLADAGVAPEGRAFHPHLTLARWRDRQAVSRRSLAALIERGSDRTVATVTVSAVTLFQSRLSPAGPSYTVLARAGLVC
jgi:2'-5' RNA ligase